MVNRFPRRSRISKPPFLNFLEFLFEHGYPNWSSLLLSIWRKQDDSLLRFFFGYKMSCMMHRLLYRISQTCQPMTSMELFVVFPTMLSLNEQPYLSGARATSDYQFTSHDQSSGSGTGKWKWNWNSEVPESHCTHTPARHPWPQDNWAATDVTQRLSNAQTAVTVQACRK